MHRKSVFMSMSITCQQCVEEHPPGPRFMPDYCSQECFDAWQVKQALMGQRWRVTVTHRYRTFREYYDMQAPTEASACDTALYEAAENTGYDQEDLVVAGIRGPL